MKKERRTVIMVGLIFSTRRLKNSFDVQSQKSLN